MGVAGSRDRTPAGRSRLGPRRVGERQVGRQRQQLVHFLLQSCSFLTQEHLENKPSNSSGQSDSWASPWKHQADTSPLNVSLASPWKRDCRVLTFDLNIIGLEDLTQRERAQTEVLESHPEEPQPLPYVWISPLFRSVRISGSIVSATSRH